MAENLDAMMHTSTTTQAHRSLLVQWLIRKTANAGMRRVAHIGASLATDIGGFRSENQDRVVSARFWDGVGRPYTCTAVVDGMGGMQAGEESAALTLAAFIYALRDGVAARHSPEEALARAAQAANRVVYAKRGGRGGATLSALLTTPEDKAYWVNVGDSRVYAGAPGKLSQLSVDDTLAGQLARPIEDDHNDSQLIQFIGVGEGLEPHVGTIDIGGFEWYLLTSDGVHNMPAAVDLMSRLVDHAADPGVAAKRLVEVARWCGGRDNATVAVVSARAERGAERPHQVGCMEVWDPFGDLHVVVEHAVVEEKPKPQRTRSTRQPNKRQSAANVAKNKERTPEIAVNRPLPGITELEPDAREGSASDEAPESAEPPQLQIDFPSQPEK